MSAVADQTEREALTKAFGVSNGTQVWLEFQGGPDEMLAMLHAAGFHRTPTPHVVTTREEVHAMHERGDRRWMETANGDIVTATVLAMWLGDPENTGMLPATVLTPAPAPIDREALALRICHARRGHVTPGTYGCGLCRGEVDRVLDAIEGESRG